MCQMHIEFSGQCLILSTCSERVSSYDYYKKKLKKKKNPVLILALVCEKMTLPRLPETTVVFADLSEDQLELD